jgi:hypothetical protein
MTEQLVEFMWQTARPDSRQYRQNSAELYPQQFVIGVNVPLTKDYILNAEELIQFDLGSGNATRPTPIYTPLAVRYCLDKLGEHLVDAQTSTSKVDNDDWDDDKKTETSNPDDGWGEDNKKDVPWKEEDEDWS